MKKILVVLIGFVCLFLCACTNNTDSKKFTEEYEKLNNKKTSYSKDLYRSLEISNKNPFVYSDAKKIVEMIENNESFYVYFGSSYCPWCRSVIEEAIKSAKQNNIKKIYYVNIWKGFHEEILRDTYELNKEGKPELSKNGTREYYILLEKLDNVLEDYTLTDDDNNKVKVNEKRIFAPTFIKIENGKAVKMKTGISDKQTKSSQKLNKKILNDEEKQFNELFSN